VDAYLTGDKKAGQKLYIETIPYVKKFVLSRTVKSSLAEQDKEDIVMDSLKLSIENLDRYTGESSFCVFACGFAKNKIAQAYDKHSKNKALVPLEDTFEDISESDSFEEFGVVTLYQPSENPVNIVIRKEEADALKKAYSLLSQDYQQIIHFRLFNKVPVKQVSELTGKTEDSIDAMYRRALKKYIENFKKIYFGTTDLK
jgi:RNA polymerase sigma factor (sigma-70 family)